MPEPRLLSRLRLDKIWAWYTSWVTSDPENFVPTLNEHDFKRLTRYIEDLFDYIAFLENTIEEVRDSLKIGVD